MRSLLRSERGKCTVNMLFWTLLNHTLYHPLQLLRATLIFHTAHHSKVSMWACAAHTSFREFRAPGVPLRSKYCLLIP